MSTPRLQQLFESTPDYLARSPDLAISYVTDHLLPALQEALSAVATVAADKHVAARQPLTHYTSIGALVNMLRPLQPPNTVDHPFLPHGPSAPERPQSFLRLYDSAHLNDPNEGRELVQRIRSTHEWLQDPTGHAYLASFVLPGHQGSATDELMFWRTYGLDGRGCAITFTPTNGVFHEVHYGDSPLQRTAAILDSFLHRLVSLRRDFQRFDDRSAKELPVSLTSLLNFTVWRSLEQLRYLYKSAPYSHERECRFVVPEANLSPTAKVNIGFDDSLSDRCGTVRHYYNHDHMTINNILITGSVVTIGPSVKHPSNIQYYLNTLLQRAKLGGVIVTTSAIQYRASA